MSSTNYSRHLNNQSRPVGRSLFLLWGMVLFIQLILNSYATILYLNGLKDWQFLLYYSSSILTFILLLLTFRLLWNKKIAKAGWLLLSIIFCNVILITLLFTGIGLILQVVSIVSGTIIAFEITPPRSRNIAFVMTVISAIASYGSELLPTLWRISLLNFDYSIQFGLVILILFLFGLYLFKNFNKFTLRTRLFFVIVGINISTIILLGLSTNIFTRQVTHTNTRNKMLEAARNLANEAEIYTQNLILNTLINAKSLSLTTYMDLSSIEQEESSEHRRINSLLNSWVNNSNNEITTISLLDINGVNIFDTLPSNISKNESNYNYYRFPFDTGLPFISPVLQNKYNEPALIVSAPIHDSSDNIAGILRIQYRGELLQSIISHYDELIGNGSFGVLFDENGIILAHSKEHNLINQPITGLGEDKIKNLQQEMRLSTSFRRLDYPQLRNNINSISNQSIIESPLLYSEQGTDGTVASIKINSLGWIASIFLPKVAAYPSFLLQTNPIILISEAVTILVFILAVISSSFFTKPINELATIAKQFHNGQFQTRANLIGQDEVGILAHTLNTMGDQLKHLLNSLEKQVDESTRGIEISAFIGRRISNIYDETILISEVVNQIQEAFNYYSVLIYLFSIDKEILTIKGGTGEAGRSLIAQQHTIRLGVGPIGKAAKSANVVFVQDTSMDSDWIPNPLLPKTTKELAVPILLGKDVLGVIDVQVDNIQSLDGDDADPLRLIATQVAISLRNTKFINNAQEEVERTVTKRKIIQQIRSTTEADRAIKISVREIGRITKSPQTFIKFDIEK